MLLNNTKHIAMIATFLLVIISVSPTSCKFAPYGVLSLSSFFTPFYIFLFYFILKDVILFHDIEDTYKSFDFFITSKIEKVRSPLFWSLTSHKPIATISNNFIFIISFWFNRCIAVLDMVAVVTYSVV